MMRGTVFAIQEDGEGHQTIARMVVTVNEAESAVQFMLAVQHEQRPYPADARIEFGPIGPPWRKLV